MGNIQKLEKLNQLFGGLVFLKSLLQIGTLAFVNSVRSLVLGPLLPGCQNSTSLRKNAVIPAGITEEAKKIQKACSQI